MYRKYQTNQQAWNEVMSNIKESKRKAQNCKELFGKENLIGHTTEQKELFYEKKRKKKIK